MVSCLQPASCCNASCSRHRGGMMTADVLWFSFWRSHCGQHVFHSRRLSSRVFLKVTKLSDNKCTATYETYDFYIPSDRCRYTRVKINLSALLPSVNGSRSQDVYSSRRSGSTPAAAWTTTGSNRTSALFCFCLQNVIKYSSNVQIPLNCIQNKKHQQGCNLK